MVNFLTVRIQFTIYYVPRIFFRSNEGAFILVPPLATPLYTASTVGRDRQISIGGFRDKGAMAHPKMPKRFYEIVFLTKLLINVFVCEKFQVSFKKITKQTKRTAPNF